jgi:hypothetical protein
MGPTGVLRLMSTIVRSCFWLAPALLITASDWLTAAT